MSDKTIGLEQIEEDILSYEVSDESLETAASAKAGAYTLGFCTGLSACPAP
jgi:hypothetical protein